MVVPLGLLLLGCTERPVPTAGAGSAPPPGAIAVGDDVYMVPLDQPVEDCPAYRLYSPTKMVDQAIYYRDRQGGFTRDRGQAQCG